MCYSPEVSFVAAAVLLPAGAIAMIGAYRREKKLLPLAALPIMFGAQQFFEGLVWLGNSFSNEQMVAKYSLAYMFFSWLAWPVWIPLSAYFLEPCRRRHVYVLFAILGGMVGAMQYFPYLAHEGWLKTTFLPNAVVYEGTVLFDFIMRRELTYVVYLVAILAPLLTSSDKRARTFGGLIALVLAVTYLFFSYAYISVFCFGGAFMSLYILFMVFAASGPQRSSGHPTQTIDALPNGA